jgi:hypothetical protein
MLSLWRKQTIISRQALVTLSEATLSGDSSERKKRLPSEVPRGWQLGGICDRRAPARRYSPQDIFFWRQEVVEDPSIYAWVFWESFFRRFSHCFHSELLDSDM